MEYVSRVTLYNFRDGAIAGWEFIPLDRLDSLQDPLTAPANVAILDCFRGWLVTRIP